MIKNTDYTSSVVNYIKKNLKKGYTKESLKWALIGQGHSKLELEKAFKIVKEELAHSAPLLKTKPVIKHAFIETKTNTEIPIKTSKKSFWKRFFD